MANIKEKKTRTKKSIPAKNARKKISVRIEGKKLSRPEAPTIGINKEKEIVEKEILKAEKNEMKINGNHTPPQSGFYSDEAQLEKSKKIIMWSGVAFFMILISSIWIYMLTNNINESTNANGTNSNSELKDTLAKSMQDFKDSLAAFKELKNSIASTSTGTLENYIPGNVSSSTEPSISTSTTATSAPSFVQATLPRAATVSTSTSQNTKVDKNELIELRKKLGELEKRLKEIN